MSGFVVQGPKSDDRDSLGLKNGLYPQINGTFSIFLYLYPCTPLINHNGPCLQRAFPQLLWTLHEFRYLERKEKKISHTQVFTNARDHFNSCRIRGKKMYPACRMVCMVES